MAKLFLQVRQIKTNFNHYEVIPVNIVTHFLFRCRHWGCNICSSSESYCMGRPRKIRSREIQSREFRGQASSCFCSFLSKPKVDIMISFVKFELMDDFNFLSLIWRNCIGQHFAMHEMRSVLGVCLKKFEFRVSEDNAPVLAPELVLRAKNGLWLKVSLIEYNPA